MGQKNILRKSTSYAILTSRTRSCIPQDEKAHRILRCIRMVIHENTRPAVLSWVSVWLFFPRIVCRITICGKACFRKPYKCIAGFS